MKLTKVKMDLFESDTKYDLCHCISFDCAMGAGIALEFRQRYPEMPDKIKEFIISNMCSFKPCSIGYNAKDRIIFNLITKDQYYSKPTYTTISKALVELRRHMTQYNRKYVAMPLIGCGLDALNWGKVEDYIYEAFGDSDIEILVCIKK